MSSKNRARRVKRTSSAILAAAVCALAAPRGRADTWTWNGAVDNAFGSPQWDANVEGIFVNWSHSGSEFASYDPVSSADTVVAFNAVETNAPQEDIANPFTLNSLQFDSGSSPVTLTVGTLKFVNNSSSTTPTIVQNSSSAQIVEENLDLSNNTTYSGTGSGTVAISALISGAKSLTLNGVGPIALNQSNSYTGGTIFDSGTVTFANSAAFSDGFLTLNGGQIISVNNAVLNNPFSDTSTSTVGFQAATGTTLTLNNTFGTLLTNNNLTFGSPSNTGEILFQPGPINFFDGGGQGTLSVNGGELFDVSGTLSQISFAYDISVAAGATLDYNNNSATVDGLFGAGTLQLGTNPAFVLTLNSANFSGNITGSGSLVAQGNVILTSANSFSGPTTIQGGELGFGNSSALSSGSVTIAQTASLFAAGANQIMNNPIVISPGATLDVIDDPSGTHNLTLAGSITGNVSIAKLGNGILTLAGSLGTGNYTVLGGQLDFLSENITLGPAGINVAAGAEAEYNDTSVEGGVLSGAGTQEFLGANFTGVTVANGTTVIQLDPSDLTNFTNNGLFNSFGNLEWDAGENGVSGVLNVSGNTTLDAFENLGVINLLPGGVIVDSEGGLYLGGGSRMYIGSASAMGGQLEFNAGNSLEVNGALLVNNGTIQGETDINFGGLAEGGGTYGLVNVTTGGVFQPGNSPGGSSPNGALVNALTGNGTVDNQSAGGDITLFVDITSTSTFSGVIQNTTGSLSLFVGGTGALALAGTLGNTYRGGTTVQGATLVIAQPGELPPTGTLAISQSGNVRLAKNTQTSSQNALSISSGGTLDIGNNTFAINFGSPAADPIATIVSYLKSGFTGGNWTGTGIISGTAAATVGAIPVVSVGYLDGNADTGTTAGPNQIIIKYVEAADANLDGRVNFTDYSILIANFGLTGTDWAHGNFLYGPGTNFGDYSKLIANFGLSLPAGSSVANGGGGTISLSSELRIIPDVGQLPEPCCMSLLAAGAGWIVARRRSADLSSGRRLTRFV